MDYAAMSVGNMAEEHAAEGPLPVSNASTFRLTENERGKVRLSELGRTVLRSDQEAHARVDAFLAVPLYGKLFERYKGYTLAPTPALEREMIGLGVSSKQADKARQSMESVPGLHGSGRRVADPPGSSPRNRLVAHRPGTPVDAM